ncbi:ArsR/SmtB family transcription factor [Maritalea mediterranea]|uniref:Metalloregulator ArsR/SmtB family transcription factor n=1 Tax=Maritalea mediterranea TaxID=2909667 RepID=A0ABS9E9V2_9HYPH|nr:metalloregulator ArsR/SmtB family transcription factor [Maritalea mediterranea]MCF4098977.1 metalloregulator ArsR/SmtB family transcription factor [Maritalea mediterranea]
MSLQAVDLQGKSPENSDVSLDTDQTSVFLKAIAHEGRLSILCRLAEGEASVSDLENLLNARQAAVSQQLARLRQEGLVNTRRDGKAIYYSLEKKPVRTNIENLYRTFCIE